MASIWVLLQLVDAFSHYGLSQGTDKGVKALCGHFDEWKSIERGFRHSSPEL